MASERGVYAIDRGLFDHPFFKAEPFTEREAWSWLIGQAAWKPRKARVGRGLFDLDRGQCVFALRFLATKWRWTEPRVRRFLKRAETDAMLCVLATRDATVITICNYDKFQFSRRTSDAQNDAPTDELATHSRRKEEERKELKKEEAPSLRSEDRSRGTRLSDDWVPTSEDRTFAAELTGSQAVVEREFQKFRDYWRAKAGKDARKVNWSLTFRNWIRNAVDRGGRGPPSVRHGAKDPLAGII